MKRMVLSLGFATASLLAFSQSDNYYNAGGVFLKGGLSYAKFSSTKSANMQSDGGLGRVHVGLVVDFPIAESFVSFQPGVLLSGKGGKVLATIPGKLENDKNFYEATVTPLYIEVPLNVVVKIPFTERARFIFGGGPYAAMGLTGKVKGKRTEEGVVTDYRRPIIYADANPYNNGVEDTDVFKMNRFEFGLNALIGVETDQYMVTAGYGHGLSRVNMYQRNSQDANHNRVFSVSFGYKLGYREY